ncbi:MAG: hypothetical protein QOD46_620 [Actinomycetota bacterium]|nr:hypothetical protein [Actinomycetota bacterium]
MTGINGIRRESQRAKPHGAGPEHQVPEGWYLMSTEMVERMLERRRAGSVDVVPPDALHLTIEEALAYRDGGNFPDEHGRTLRLLLLARDRDEVRNLSTKRLQFEPDYHEAPAWRREGSKPVTVVPLREEIEPAGDGPWWEEPELAAMESEWQTDGMIDGLQIPSDLRGLVYKTILSLRAARRDVTVETVCDSLARWLLPAQAAEIRSALERANDSLRESPPSTTHRADT